MIFVEKFIRIAERLQFVKRCKCMVSLLNIKAMIHYPRFFSLLSTIFEFNKLKQQLYSCKMMHVLNVWLIERKKREPKRLAHVGRINRPIWMWPFLEFDAIFVVDICPIRLKFTERVFCVEISEKCHKYCFISAWYVQCFTSLCVINGGEYTFSSGVVVDAAVFYGMLDKVIMDQNIYVAYVHNGMQHTTQLSPFVFCFFLNELWRKKCWFNINRKSKINK